jgi:Kef-type K+ transport system membrane component KefB
MTDVMTEQQRADTPPPPPSRRRLLTYYAILGVLTAAVIAVVLVVGSSGRHAQPAIAGGYDVAAGSSCLGAQIEIAQSGQFVQLSNTASTVSGAVRLRSGRLTGTVTCADGRHAALAATVDRGTLHGTVGGAPVSAVESSDPPAPGTPAARLPGSITGVYALAPASACLGGSVSVTNSAKGQELNVAHANPSPITYSKGAISGAVACAHSGHVALAGTASGRSLNLTTTPPAGSDVPAEHVSATLQRASDKTVEAFFLAALIVMLFARLCGSIMPRLGQPRVMGEVIAGLLLGPTVFGVVDPGLQSKLFASDIVPYIGVTANLGLVFFMFLVGLEVDLSQLKGRVGTTLAISNTGLAFPLMLGMAAAIPLYTLLAPDVRFAGFAVFIGVSMSVTAFPVLARIISERRMLKRPLGTMALSAAAVDDTTAWFLIALATAIAGSGSGVTVVRTIVEAIAFCLVMGLVVRPFIARAAVAYDELGRLPGSWITVIFAGVLASAVVTEQIGVAVILGAFVMGLIMPRHAGLSRDVNQRVEDLVLTLLLPLYFAYTGLRTNVALLGQSELIWITLGLIAIAVIGKFGGTIIASRTMRFPWRQSAALGVLMNTRGLTELIVLNLALDMGVISQALFTGLVVMALVTTLVTGPLMKLIDPRNLFGAPPEAELEAAPRLLGEGQAAPARAILVAPQSEAALAQLLSIASPLARWKPPREVVLVRLVRPPRGSSVRAGLQTQEHLVQEASHEVQRARLQLVDAGIASRAVAVASANPGSDLVRMSSSDEIDLLLVDGRRPLLGGGVPREDVGAVLASAKCDVGVLVARDSAPIRTGPDARIIVPFGGAEHDWAALELGAWFCAATGSRLELLGPPGQTEDGKDAAHMLANAALLVQQFAGVSASATVAESGRDGIIAAAQHASLLVIGLSERWHREGLGSTRQAIARAAPAPIMFARRGERPGALTPDTSATRFAWSSVGPTPGGLGGLSSIGADDPDR